MIKITTMICHKLQCIISVSLNIFRMLGIGKIKRTHQFPTVNHVRGKWTSLDTCHRIQSNQFVIWFYCSLCPLTSSIYKLWYGRHLSCTCCCNFSIWQILYALFSLLFDYYSIKLHDIYNLNLNNIMPYRVSWWLFIYLCHKHSIGWSGEGFQSNYHGVIFA